MSEGGDAPTPNASEESNSVTLVKRSREEEESSDNNNLTQPDASVATVNIPKKAKSENVSSYPVKKSSTFPYPKNVSVGVIPEGDLDRVKLESLRGNYWKTMGHSSGGMNYLYLEEALYLVEKHQLVIKEKILESETQETENDGDVSHIPSRQLYELVVKSLSLECYLTYLKLKSLDYVVHRSGTSGVRSFCEEASVLASFRQHLAEYRRGHEESRSTDGEPQLLDFMSSFDIYLVGDNYTKRNAASEICLPVAHVIVTSCPKLYSSTLMLTLLKQSRGTPCLFAVVMPHSGFVMLEEMTDAEHSLSWDFGTMNKADNMNLAIDLRER